jgi:magnesium-dependent phosphatase 1
MPNVTEKKRKRQEAAAQVAIAKAAKVSPLETSQHGQHAEQELSSLSILPTLVVFDLDDTLWIGDIDMTSGPPFRTDGRGLPVLAKNGGHGDKIVPCADVPEIMDWLEAQGIKVAISTHTFKPNWAEEVLGLLETASGTKYSDLLVCPVGSDVQRKCKDVHMQAISTTTGIACDDMVFFDDKDHNVKDVQRVGVVGRMVTSDGLTWDKFLECLRSFEEKKGGGSGVSAPQPIIPKGSVARSMVPNATRPTPLPKVAAAPNPATAKGVRPQWAARPHMNAHWNLPLAQGNAQLAALMAQWGGKGAW